MLETDVLVGRHQKVKHLGRSNKERTVFKAVEFCLSASLNVMSGKEPGGSFGNTMIK